MIGATESEKGVLFTGTAYSYYSYRQCRSMLQEAETMREWIVNVKGGVKW